VSFITGLVWGLFITALQIASEHYAPSDGPISLSGNGALAVPVVLIPLSIYWGYNWIANRWSGRSVIPSVAYVAGLWVGVGLASPADALLFPQTGATFNPLNAALALVANGAIFVLPVALIAGALYWLLKSERFTAGGIILLILYGIGLVISVAIPFFGAVFGGGVIAGTAAGHAWRRGRGGWVVFLLVLVLMLVAVLGVPFVQGGGVNELRRYVPIPTP
jgi:hypothetical protein